MSGKVTPGKKSVSKIAPQKCDNCHNQKSYEPLTLTWHKKKSEIIRTHLKDEIPFKPTIRIRVLPKMAKKTLINSCF